MNSIEISFKMPLAARGIRRYFKRKVTFRFDMFAWLLACEARGLQIWELTKMDQTEMTYALIYGAAASSCYLNRKKIWFSQALCYYWVTEVMTNKQCLELFKIAQESQAFNIKVPAAESEGGDEKK